MVLPPRLYYAGQKGDLKNSQCVQCVIVRIFSGPGLHKGLDLELLLNSHGIDRLRPAHGADKLVRGMVDEWLIV